MDAMKKAFNNPVVVGVLVLCAIAFVFRDVIHFSSVLKTRPSANAQAVSPPTVKTPAPHTVRRKTTDTRAVNSSAAPLKHTDWKRLAQILLPERDPFSPASMSRQGETDTALNPAQEEASAMKLNAIVTAEHVHYATINGHLLTTGERINGWTLTAIGVNRVQLRGKAGLLTLDINGDMHMGEKALETERKDRYLFDSLQKRAIVPATRETGTGTKE